MTNTLALATVDTFRNGVWHMDAETLLRSLPAGSVHCLITSPPYYGLRSYLPDDHPDKAAEIGLDETPDAYVARLVALFELARRALRDDGVLWLNLGDSYASGEVGRHDSRSGRAYGARMDGKRQQKRLETGLQQKQLLGVPWRVAFALQAAGWWLRSAPPWIKKSPMPESVTDRPTTANEFVFMFAKSGSTQFWTHRDHAGTRTPPPPDYRWIHRKTNEERLTPPDGWNTDKDVRKAWRRVNLWSGRDYWYDADGVREEHQEVSLKRIEYGLHQNHPDNVGIGIPPVNTDKMGTRFCNPAGRNRRTSDFFFESLDAYIDHLQHVREHGGMMLDEHGLPMAIIANTEPKSFKHFAMFPSALIEPLILAGCPAQVCGVCGAGWARVVERKPGFEAKRQFENGLKGRRTGAATNSEYRGIGYTRSTTLGFAPTCDCNAPTSAGIVLDPFMGSGTTALVAQRLGRDFIGCDVNAEYVALANERLHYHGEDSRMVQESEAGVKQLALLA